MEKRDFERLRLITPPLYAHEEPMVSVPTIDFDTELDAFYIAAGEGGTFTLTDKQLPANFHTHELMDVDPADTAALLSFQRQWGFLTSTRRVPLIEDTLGTPPASMATPMVNKSDEEALSEAIKLRDGLASRHEDFKKLEGLLRISSAPGRNGAYTFVPRAEAEATLRWLQEKVPKLVDAHTVGFDNWSGIEGRNLKSLVGHINATITPYFPMYRMGDKGIEGSKAVAPILPLTIATLAQLFAYIASDEGYRVCKQCGKYFLYKRHTSGEYERKRRSKYCSEPCKERASWTAQADKRKTKRNEGKGSEEGR